MQNVLNKRIVFVILAVLAIVTGYQTIKTDPLFLNNIWSQLFWLVVETIAITFVLEAVLEHDRYVRVRNADALAVRTFLTIMLNQIIEICGSHIKKLDVLQTASLNRKEYATTIQAAADSLLPTADLQVDRYNHYYLDVSLGLRNMAQNYVRLFASNRQDMVHIFDNLQALASRWVYIESYPGETESARRQEASTVVLDTARYLAHLAERTAKGLGLPPP